MKKLPVFFCCIALLSFLPVSRAEKTFFYFFISKSGNTATDGTPIKYTILLSKIHQLSNTESVFREKAKQWQNWVDTRCVSKTRCVGDTNYYQTEEEAGKAYENFIEVYSDSSKYLVQHVDFR
jgi:hypothetical protein